MGLVLGAASDRLMQLLDFPSAVAPAAGPGQPRNPESLECLRILIARNEIPPDMAVPAWYTERLERLVNRIEDASLKSPCMANGC